MDLNYAKATLEISKTKLNPFLQIEQRNNNNKFPKFLNNNLEEKSNPFANQEKKSAMELAQQRFKQNAHRLQENKSKYQQNFLEENKNPIQVIPKNAEDLNKNNNIFLNQHDLKNMNNPLLVNLNKLTTKVFGGEKFKENKENFSYVSNLNNITNNNMKNNKIESDNEATNFDKDKNKINCNLSLENNSNILIKKKNDFCYKNFKEKATENCEHIGVSQLQMSQLEIAKGKSIDDDYKNSESEIEDHEGSNNNDKLTEENENNNQNTSKENNDENKIYLFNPFENNSLGNKQILNKRFKENFKNINENESQFDLPNDYLNRELRNISKKVINFKLKEENSNEQFKNNPEIKDVNILSKLSNFTHFDKNKKTDFTIPFPNMNQKFKNNNNNNFYLELLAKNKNNINCLDSGITSKNLTTKDNSISSLMENEKISSEKVNFQKTIKDSDLKPSFSFKTDLKNQPNNEKTSSDISFKVPNESKETAKIELTDDTNNFQPVKIFKIKEPKANDFKTEKKKESAIDISLLKKRKVTINPSKSVKKYVEPCEDYFLDLEIHKRNCQDAAKYYTEIELNKLNTTEQNILNGKVKLNTDKRKYCGKFNQLNGEKIESYNVYRDEDILIPSELQSKIHIKPENEKFDEDISSCDEVIQVAKVHYNMQFNILKLNNFNFYQCNNLKYTQGLYWDS